ncbi:MAG: YciI family protein [Cellulomonadaceae bacterium]
MSIYAVEYTYANDPKTLDEVRPQHRAYLAERLAEGSLIASGPYTQGAAGALLLFQVAELPELERILANDPFELAGVIDATSIRPWNPVFAIWS